MATKEFFLIKYAQGNDGGFGDYCSPDWTWARNVTDKDGNPLWFDNAKDAKDFAEKCSEYAAKEFYRFGEHSQYDGNFPVEYEVFSFSIPTTPAATDPKAEFDRLAPSITKDAKDAAHYMFGDWDDDDDDW